MNYYRQCVLEKVNTRNGEYVTSYYTTTTWIPEQFAKVGHYVKLKKKSGWEDGWKVTEVGVRAPEDQVLEHERDWLCQRKASDI